MCVCVRVCVCVCVLCVCVSELTVVNLFSYHLSPPSPPSPPSHPPTLTAAAGGSLEELGVPDLAEPEAVSKLISIIESQVNVLDKQLE